MATWREIIRLGDGWPHQQLIMADVHRRLFGRTIKRVLPIRAREEKYQDEPDVFRGEFNNIGPVIRGSITLNMTRRKKRVNKRLYGKSNPSYRWNPIGEFER